jgi:AraC family transcriptional regulator
MKEIHKFLVRPDFSIRYSASVGCAFEPHSHHAYCVTAVLAGEMSASIEDQKALISTGGAGLTGVGQTHSASASEVEFLTIAIKPEYVGELAAEIGLISTAAEIVFGQPFITDSAISSIGRAISEEIKKGEVGHAAMIDSLSRQLAIHLLRTHLTVKKSALIELSRAGPVDRRLRRAIEFMHDNFARELALEEIAAAAYLSEYHFARLFKQITGLTPHFYLANLRLERARVLLAETSLSINEVAASVGYHSQSHFTKMFKSVAGITPSSYRESAIGERVLGF